MVKTQYPLFTSSTLPGVFLYAKLYTEWRNETYNEEDENHHVIKGQELNDFFKIIDLIKSKTGKTVSLFECQDLMFQMAKTSVTNEEEAMLAFCEIAK